MTDLTKHILAYALQNALEHGKADAKFVLPKLFQHGLKKKDIKEIMPEVTKTVKEINALSDKERAVAFEQARAYVKERVEQEKQLAPLPGITKVDKPVFRVAPFPSGALHLGNSKTFLLNDLYARKYSGKTILVMDDTIGSVEKPITEQSYALIEDAMHFLRIMYDAEIVYKSDRIKLYYEYAEKLIKKEKAYVCHCAQEKLAKNRREGIECSCRQFPVEEQLKRWKEMFKLAEGAATLRLKTDMMHPNPAFRDRVLFRIADREHPRVGTKYRVWPTLEMTWAVDDHLLGMTHIIRGSDLMIETDMEKYIWDIFGWDHPVIVHAGRVQITEDGKNLLSKSKSQKEVMSGAYEEGWYDPRTWSVQSLARRGITHEAIRAFVEDIGLNRQDITVPIDNLYAINRKLIDPHANRYSFIRKPREVVIEKYDIQPVEIPLHPDRPEMRKVEVNRIFIEDEDYEKHIGDEIRLLHLCNVKLHKKDAKFTSVENKKKIPKLNWVSATVQAKVLMPNGEWIQGVADAGVRDLEEGTIIQFERFGFVRFDKMENGVYHFWFAHK